MTIQLPEGGLHQNIAVLGKNGSGKTYAAKGWIVERLLGDGRRVGIVDPTGAWWGLRSSRDGKGPGFKVLVLGGDHGDLPLAPNSGAAVARLLAEQGVSLVADTTQMTVGERTRWFTDFASTLYRANKLPLHLVLDEAHNFAPQGKVPDPDAGKMLHAASTLASQGRSRGIRLTMITQRPQKLHKDSLTTAETLIAMRVIHPLDRGAIADWIKGCGVDGQGEEVMKSLANLKKGEGWAWYPEGGFLHRMKFPGIKTFDSSATPMEGGQVATPKAAAKIDLEEVRAAMADAIKEAEANDPKLLRAEIARLTRELAAKPAQGPSINLDDVRAEAFQQGVASAWGEVESLQHAVGEHLNEAAALRDKIAAQIRREKPKLPHRAPPAPTVSHSNHAPAARKVSPKSPQAAPATGISRPRQLILDGLIWLESVGVMQPDKVQVSLLAEQSSKSSGYANNLSGLRSAGLVDYPGPSLVCLTDAGRRAANAPEAILTIKHLHDALKERLPAPQWRILDCLIEQYPHPIDREAVAVVSGQSPTSSGFANNLSRLRSLGFLDYPSRSQVVGTAILFLKR